MNDDHVYGIFKSNGTDSDDCDNDSNENSNQSSNDDDDDFGFPKRNKQRVSNGRRKKSRNSHDNNEVIFIPSISAEQFKTLEKDADIDIVDDKDCSNHSDDDDGDVHRAFEEALGEVTSNISESAKVSLSNDQFRHYLNSSESKEKPKAAYNLPKVSLKDLGSWEKHTKGIGSKLLSKFGFTGRLGANENGVSKSIEVVVRPNGVGLGFGDIKEASQLKTNKIIEAEWYGKPLDIEALNASDIMATRKDNQKDRNSDKSDIELVADSKSWKKTKKGNHKNDLQTATEIINQQKKFGQTTDFGNGTSKQVIIDMRYEDTRIITDLSAISDYSNSRQSQKREQERKTKLGEELLYNINLVCDMIEIDLYSSSRKLGANNTAHGSKHEDSTGAKKQLQISSEDAALLEKQVGNNLSKLERLQSFQKVLDRIEEKHFAMFPLDSSTGFDSDSSILDEYELKTRQKMLRNSVALFNTSKTASVKDVLNMLRTLHTNFRDEFTLFGVIDLLPTLLGPVINQQCNNVVQLLLQNRSTAVADTGPKSNSECIDLSFIDQVLYEYDEFARQLSSEGDASAAGQCRGHLSALFESHYIPLIRRILLNVWVVSSNDSHDTPNPWLVPSELRLMDEVVRFLQVLWPMISTAQRDEVLSQMIILPKLTSVLETQWQPNDSSTPNAADIHLLLHPWLPLMRNKLSALYPLVRRKMNTFINRTDWTGSIESTVHTSEIVYKMLVPWQSIFDMSSYYNLINQAVMPKLANLLRNSFVINPGNQRLDLIEIVFKFKDVCCIYDQLSRAAFDVNGTNANCYLSLFQGEFFNKWLSALSLWLCSATADLEEVSVWYSGWKQLFVDRKLLIDDDQDGESVKNSYYSPLEEYMSRQLSKPFQAALQMMALKLDDDNDMYDSSRDGNSSSGSASSLLLSQVNYGDISHLSYKSVLESYEKEARIQARLQQISGGSRQPPRDNKSGEITGSLLGQDNFRESLSSDTTGARYRFSGDEVKGRSGRNVTGGVVNITFREVVEHFAEKNSIVFHPLSERESQRLVASCVTVGGNEGPEGKQMYLFGNIPCYIDQNVLFTASVHSAVGGKRRDWMPTDLDDLLMKVQAQAK